jgi:hypothetical protein
MILKNVAGQGVYLFAWNAVSNMADTGDAANITGSYTLDGTDHSGFGTAHPTEIAVGIYWQPLAQGETNGNMISYRWASTTSGVQIQPSFVSTTGVNLPVGAPGAAGGLFVAGTNAATIVTGSLTTTFTGNLTGNVGGSSVPVNAIVTAINGQSPPGNWSALSIDALGRIFNAPAGWDSIVIEAGINPRQSLAIIGAAVAGVGGPTTGTYVGMNNSTVRIGFSDNSAGQRTAVTCTPPT